MSKKVLILNWSPPPVSEHPYQGSNGLRAYRIALGLIAHGVKNVTIAINPEYKLKTKIFNGIKLISYNISSIKNLISKYDSVIYSASLSKTTELFTESIPNKTQVIVDAYAPYHLEYLEEIKISNRPSDLKDRYLDICESFSKSILSCDYYLISSENQSFYYKGLIAGIGGANLASTYRQLLVPQYPETVGGYVDRKKESLDSRKNSKINIVWFGGIYPWYDVGELIDIFKEDEISSKCNLIFVGAKNPFFKSDDDDFNSGYNKAYGKSKTLDILNKCVFFRPWTKYQDRLEEFINADISISLNDLNSIENNISSRIRTSDILAHGVPLITNGGDPVSDKALKLNVGYVVDIDNLREDIIKIISDKSAIKNKALRLLQDTHQEELTIYKYVESLAKVITSGAKPRLHANRFIKNLYQINIEYQDTVESLKNRLSKEIEEKKSFQLEKINQDSIINDLHTQLMRANHELEIIYKKPHIYLYKKFKKLINKF